MINYILPGNLLCCFAIFGTVPFVTGIAGQPRLCVIDCSLLTYYRCTKDPIQVIGPSSVSFQIVGKPLPLVMGSNPTQGFTLVRNLTGAQRRDVIKPSRLLVIFRNMSAHIRVGKAFLFFFSHIISLMEQWTPNKVKGRMVHVYKLTLSCRHWHVCWSHSFD